MQAHDLDAKASSKPEYEVWDVVVIGAGIQGAGVAQAMAAYGVRTLLLDRALTPASETSSKSSKLIHGGLRYLETGQLGLVYECLRERKILTRIAPKLVALKSFYIPVYKNQKRSPLWVWAGLLLYGLLGGGRCRWHCVSKAQTLGLNLHNLQALFEYQDAQTDDVALTCAVVDSAINLGASVLLGFEVAALALNTDGFSISAADGREVRATCLINAAGAWVNNVAALEPLLPQTAIDLVQGTHLVLDLPAPEGCIYTESPDDGRAVFLLPWRGNLMVGTTELSRGQNAEANEVTQAERDYLLRVVAHALPAVNLQDVKIVHEFSGLRVLPSGHSGANNPTGKARETRLVHSLGAKPYLAIYGGKLTSYRATAQKVLAILKPWLPATHKVPTATETLPLG